MGNGTIPGNPTPRLPTRIGLAYMAPCPSLGSKFISSVTGTSEGAWATDAGVLTVVVWAFDGPATGVTPS